MIFRNPKIQKLVAVVLIISIIAPAVLLSKPKKAEAIVPVLAFLSDVWGWISEAFTGITSGSTLVNTSLSVKGWAEVIIKQVLMAVARKLLSEITKSTVNWINSGFHGSPLFVENPQSFFKDIAKSEVKSLVDTFGYDSIKFPFGKDFALSTINSYKSSLERNSAYTLSNVIKDSTVLRNYQNNFNVGGWNGFLINTQYPQNNYIGFQMIATEEAARRVQGTVDTAVGKVKNTISQGQGFLSPQICPSNPDYNNDVNEFQKPSFVFDEKFSPPDVTYTFDPSTGSTVPDPYLQQAYNNYKKEWEERRKMAEGNWQDQNTCPGGLVSTTPGSVVSNQITTALGSQFRQSELGAAMGNSLSQIFDALLNHFIDKGLNALTSSINNTPTEDNWTYEGQTLGSPAVTTTGGGAGSDWASGPDEEIDINIFKKQISGKTVITDPKDKTTTEKIGDTTKETGGIYIPGDIENTITEIALMDNPCAPTNKNCLSYDYKQSDPDYNLYNPGITQIMKVIPEEAQTLDQCLPGPDKGWENRLKNEQGLAVKPFAQAAAENPEDETAINDILIELKSSIILFKEWVNKKMEDSLPGAKFYMEAVKEIDSLNQQSNELKDNKQAKIKILLTLQTLENKLSLITNQPAPGTKEEKKLITLRQQYNAMRISVSSTITAEETRAQLETIKDKLARLKYLGAKCIKERQGEKGSVKTQVVQDPDAEIQEFCTLPIANGKSHGQVIKADWTNTNDDGTSMDFTFRNPHGATYGDSGYEDVPVVNGQNVISKGTSWDAISINLNCNVIFKARITDYTQAGDPTYSY